MTQPSDDDCVSTGKEREDRRAEANNRFEPLQLNVKCPDTAVLLLGSRERPILVAAASALTKFAAKGKENVQKLFELDVAENLIPLVFHDDLITRRFAARLLGEMSAIPLVRNYLLESETHFSRLLKVNFEDSDNFMKEYASLILAEISKDPCGVDKLLEQCSSLDFLFDNLKMPDPDIKKNHLEIINNLLKDLEGAERIIESQVFNFQTICQLLEEPYPEIQNLSLSVMESLVARNKDDQIQKLFRESGALKSLLDVLENFDFSDLHSDVLRLLVRAVENPETMEVFVSSGGIPKLFGFLEASAHARESRGVLEVLVNLANTGRGRATLHDSGILRYLFQSLREIPRDQDSCKIACYGIGTMSRYKPASEDIARENAIKIVFDILKDENLNWDVRAAAAFSLKELCTNDRKICQNFLDIQGPAYLCSLLKKTPEKVPFNVRNMIVHIFNSIGLHPDIRESFIEEELVESLCAAFDIDDRLADELKIGSCRTLMNFCVEKRTREICLDRNLVDRLFNLLTEKESIPVRAAAIQLVQQLADDPVIADQFVQAGYLNYMLKNRAVASVVPTWNSCIDSLYSAHLPVKFAATGRLGIHETTEDGFYVMRRQICPFPVLNDLFSSKMCPIEPIYVVNFADTPSKERNASRSSSLAKNSRSGSVGSRSWFEEKFGKLQKDIYLCDYLELFKCILAANESSDKTEIGKGLVDISKIALRGKLLGKFVARQMSGPDPQNPCIDHQLEVHIQEIRDDLRTNVIPLGQLRVGSYLERALLFKVLADRIFLPATLVRGEHGKAWNELAIPQIDDSVGNPDSSGLSGNDLGDESSKQSILASDSKTTKKSNSSVDVGSRKIRVLDDHTKNILPSSLLQENYLVDLIYSPGDLIPLKSSRARSYCAPDKIYTMICET